MSYNVCWSCDASCHPQFLAVSWNGICTRCTSFHVWVVLISECLLKQIEFTLREVEIVRTRKCKNIWIPLKNSFEHLNNSLCSKAGKKYSAWPKMCHSKDALFSWPLWFSWISHFWYVWVEWPDTTPLPSDRLVPRSIPASNLALIHANVGLALYLFGSRHLRHQHICKRLTFRSASGWWRWHCGMGCGFA